MVCFTLAVSRASWLLYSALSLRSQYVDRELSVAGRHLSLKMVIIFPAPAQDRPLVEVPEKQQLPTQQVLPVPTGQGLVGQVRTELNASMS